MDGWKFVRSPSIMKDELVQDITDDVQEIKKSIALVTQWKEEVTGVFNQLIGNLNQRLCTPSVAFEDSVPGNLRYIAKKVDGIKKGTENIMTLKPESNKKRKPTCWKKLVLEKEIMANADMAMALAAYDALEPRVQLCFLCLSIFPENSIIRKRSLIYWWIGEGFVDGKEAENEAEACFEKLCDSGLVEGVLEKYSRSPPSCRLHPWIRWMAIQIARETMFFDFDSDGKPTPGHSHISRRALVSSRVGEETKMRAEEVNLGPNASKMRSLFNVDVNCIKCDEEEFKKLKELVTLQLGRWNTLPEHHIELNNPIFLDHLKLLKKLRYLGLQGISRITEVAGIRQLSELRVLDLRACHNLERLPAEIASLKQLTHLDVSECYLLEYMPKGIKDLSKLQLLNGFVVNTWRQDACELTELTNLENLQKLSVSVDKEAMEKDGVLDPIGEIKSLKSLRITWRSTIEESNNTIEESNNGTRKMMEMMPRIIRAVIGFRRLLRRKPVLQPPSTKITLSLPPHLTKLDLQCYPAQEPPSFTRKLVKKESLEKLYFRGGGLKSLNGIQKDEVSDLKFIHLSFLTKFNMEKRDFETQFRGLKKPCRPQDCPLIKSWSPDEASSSTDTKFST